MAKKAKVYEITAVRLTLYKSFPSKLAIEVDAVVPTSGYENPELVESIYVHPPLDGIYDFDFYATPPSGPSLDVLTTLSAKYLMDPMPPN
jgi:hypothetical protein